MELHACNNHVKVSNIQQIIQYSREITDNIAKKENSNLT